MAPISHPDRYSHSIDFWRNVYGIDSKNYINLNFGKITTLNLIGILVKLSDDFFNHQISRCLSFILHHDRQGGSLVIS